MLDKIKKVNYEKDNNFVFIVNFNYKCYVAKGFKTNHY